MLSRFYSPAKCRGRQLRSSALPDRALPVSAPLSTTSDIAPKGSSAEGNSAVLQRRTERAVSPVRYVERIRNIACSSRVASANCTLLTILRTIPSFVVWMYSIVFEKCSLVEDCANAPDY